MMMQFKAVIFVLLLHIAASNILAQPESSTLKIFGYFQNTLTHQSDFGDDPEQNSFSVQQLNLFFQKDLAEHWTSFVNFEVLNNFSSSRQWGAFNLEEAWVKYRSNEKFNLKLGLQIPIFNHLNEIKNRTPLLPYVIRPLVYETSFSEFIAVEEATPARAFVQAYGFIPINEVKIDYACYLGNSPNITTRVPDSLDIVQTGVDSTNTFLIGGRVGIRFGELKVGFSATRDNVNFFQGLRPVVGGPSYRFEEIPRTRVGVDLTYHIGAFSLEGEFISVSYDHDIPDINTDKIFYYGTLGYNITERLFAYASYWFTEQKFLQATSNNSDEILLYTVKSDIKVPTFGLAYNLNDRIKLKAQFAPVDVENKVPSVEFYQELESNHYSMAISVFF